MLHADGVTSLSSRPPGEARLSFFFLAIFLVVGCYMPFMPVWLEARGLGAETIGLALAIPLLVRPLVTPAIAMWADVTDSHRRAAIMLAAGALLALLLLWRAQGFPAIAAALTLFTLLYSAQLPLADTVAMRAAAQGAHYGRMRIWGSLSFVAATLCAGLALDRLGAEAAMGVLAVACASVLLAALVLPRAPRRSGAASLKLDLTALGAYSGAFRDTAKRSHFWWFLLAAGLINASHAMYYTFGTVHWLSLGASGVLAGVMWAIGVLAEVVLFAVAGRRAGRVSPLIFVAVAGAAAALRWALMAIDPLWAATIALQLLHGLTFGACHLGAMFFIAGSFPPQLAGTAQALYGSLTAGVFMAAATACAGPLYRDIGAYAYLPMAAIGAIGCALALRMEVMRRAQPHSDGDGGETHAPL